jgi:hypothetical protein
MQGVDVCLQYVQKVPDFRVVGMDRRQDIELQVQVWRFAPPPDQLFEYVLNVHISKVY